MIYQSKWKVNNAFDTFIMICEHFMKETYNSDHLDESIGTTCRI